MRAGLAVSMLAMLAAAGCASSGDVRALQAPAPLPHGVIRFEVGDQYRDAVALEWIGGVSRRSYIFAEPNQRMFRPVLEDALQNAGLRAGTDARARYGLRVEVTEADGPGIGADFNAHFAATYVLIDRQHGDEVWRRDIRTPGAGHFLRLTEGDGGNVISVANPMNFLPFASDSAAERARQQGMYGGEARASVDRNGAHRAARANHAAVATNVAQFLLAFSTDHNVDMMPILPCWGSPEVEAFKQELLAAGRNFVTDNCAVSR